MSSLVNNNALNTWLMLSLWSVFMVKVQHMMLWKETELRAEDFKYRHCSVTWHNSLNLSVPQCHHSWMEGDESIAHRALKIKWGEMHWTRAPHLLAVTMMTMIACLLVGWLWVRLPTSLQIPWGQGSHLLLWTHQKFICMWSKSYWKQTGDLQKESYTSRAVEKEPHGFR